MEQLARVFVDLFVKRTSMRESGIGVVLAQKFTEPNTTIARDDGGYCCTGDLCNKKPLPSTAPTVAPTVSPCSMCQYVVNQAINHFRTGESKADVQQDLINDCQSLKRFYGDQAVTDCIQWVTDNLNVIYVDLKNDKTADQTCRDMQVC
ncbi:unnamed protein product, partial [Mesorhabditis belari]|uniref:Saposin B-type domain-containing protein n=1 Tax=Mesorhabditis belari TaxID=2138241 RepID=A0AAF3FBC9_9BILA